MILLFGMASGGAWGGTVAAPDVARTDEVIMEASEAPVPGAEAASAPVAESGLRWLDWVILAAYCFPRAARACF